MTCKTSDGVWPEEKNSSELINMVLAAIKAEQEMTDHIEEIFESSCFFDMDGQSVHIIPGMIGSCELSVNHPINSEELRAKAGRMQKLVTGFDVDISNDRGKNKKKTSRLITAAYYEINEQQFRAKLNSESERN